MLQRIQTVWLVLAVLGALFLFYTGQDVFIIKDLPILSASTIVLVLLGIFSIVSFKNRKRQLLLNKISIYIHILLMGVISYWLLKLSGGINFPEKGIEPVFVLLSIFCLVMANIYIRKDERLVKSVDRLR
jgi:hypothetical protein